MLNKTLSSYFRTVVASVELKDDGTAQADFSNAIATVQPLAGQVSRVAVSGPLSNSWTGVTGLTVPAALGYATNSDEWAALVYGQTEQFDAQGQISTSSTPSNRFVLVVAVNDVSAANQAMQEWEVNGLASESQDAFSYQFSKTIVPFFSSGAYRQIPVRYWNFPYADHSIDWAIVAASNNKNYIVISGSREAMFFIIDQFIQ